MGIQTETSTRGRLGKIIVNEGEGEGKYHQKRKKKKKSCGGKKFLAGRVAFLDLRQVWNSIERERRKIHVFGLDGRQPCATTLSPPIAPARHWETTTTYFQVFTAEQCGRIRTNGPALGRARAYST